MPQAKRTNSAPAPGALRDRLREGDSNRRTMHARFARSSRHNVAAAEGSVIRQHAPVLYHRNSFGLECASRLVVDDAELEPHHRRGRAHGKHVGHVFRERFGATKHIHHVYGYGDFGQGRAHWLAPPRLADPARIDREDAIALPVHICRYVMTRRAGSVAGPDHSDGPRPAQDGFYAHGAGVAQMRFHHNVSGFARDTAWRRCPTCVIGSCPAKLPDHVLVAQRVQWPCGWMAPSLAISSIPLFATLPSKHALTVGELRTYPRAMQGIGRTGLGVLIACAMALGGLSCIDVEGGDRGVYGDACTGSFRNILLCDRGSGGADPAARPPGASGERATCASVCQIIGACFGEPNEVPDCIANCAADVTASQAVLDCIQAAGCDFQHCVPNQQ